MGLIQIIYEVALTGAQQNFYTLYRHYMSERVCVSTFVQNLSIDFEEAEKKARLISGEDESTEGYVKRLIILDSDGVQEIIRLGTSKVKAELEGILTFGKHKHEKIEDVFQSDKKYVEWIAKGGYIYNEEMKDWYPTFDNDRAIRQQAIALLVGNGDWIERKGKFMPVDKAAKLDYIDSLTPDPSIKDGQRVKNLCVKLVGNVFVNETEYGHKASFKMVDENGHLINGATTGWFRPQQDVWYCVSFTASLYNGKVYTKRMKVMIEPLDIAAELLKEENKLAYLRQQNLLNEEQGRRLDTVMNLLDNYYTSKNIG